MWTCKDFILDHIVFIVFIFQELLILFNLAVVQVANQVLLNLEEILAFYTSVIAIWALQVPIELVSLQISRFLCQTLDLEA